MGSGLGVGLDSLHIIESIAMCIILYSCVRVVLLKGGEGMRVLKYRQAGGRGSMQAA